MSELPPCPKCQSNYCYPDRDLLICPECAHEWSEEEVSPEAGFVVKDAHGHLLQDGDSVTVIKDLKLKGGSVIKVGTKVKNIHLKDGPDGHNIDCKIKGVGAIMLKSGFVKKS